MKKTLTLLLAAGFFTSIGYATVIEIDQGNAGYTETGSWVHQDFAAGSDRVADNWRFQSTAGGAETATYTYSGLASGRYVASRSSWAQANLSSAATYSFSDGGTTYTQNQRIKVTNFDVDGPTSYQRLSNHNGYDTVRVGDGDLSVTLADTDTGFFLIADAVRLESVRAYVKKIYVIGNGDVGYAETGGTWASFSETGDHSSNFRFSGGTLADQITVSFTGLDLGMYRVSTAWTGGGNRADDVTLSYSTTGATGNTSYNQSPGAAADDVFEGVNWQDMFSDINVTDGTVTLTLQNNTVGSGNLLIGDGFRLELIDTIPEPSSLVLVGLGMCLLLRVRPAI
jgi:hypothetical protein